MTEQWIFINAASTEHRQSMLHIGELPKMPSPDFDPDPLINLRSWKQFNEEMAALVENAHYIDNDYLIFSQITPMRITPVILETKLASGGQFYQWPGGFDQHPEGGWITLYLPDPRQYNQMLDNYRFAISDILPLADRFYKEVDQSRAMEDEKLQQELFLFGKVRDMVR